MKADVCQVALTALEKAMEVERQGEVFYQEAAEHVQDPMGKAVFQALAKDEVEHLRLLQVEYDKISKDQEWLQLDEAKVCEPGIPVKLFPKKKDAKLAIRKNATDLDALKLAMDFEAKAYERYAEAGAKTDDPKGKAVFAFLSQQENSHYAFLQKTHEYLTTEGAWYFDEQEFPMFDGA